MNRFRIKIWCCIVMMMVLVIPQSVRATEVPEIISETEIAENTESTESTETTESTESTENTENTECTETTENMETTESTESTESTETTEDTENTENTESTETTESTENLEQSEYEEMIMFLSDSEMIMAYTSAESLKAGDIIEVVICTNGLELTYLEGYLGYDTELLELDKSSDIVLAEKIGDWVLAEKEEDPAYFAICPGEESSVSSVNGELVTIRFHVKQDASETMLVLKNMLWCDTEGNHNEEQLDNLYVGIYSTAMFAGDTLPDTDAGDDRAWLYTIFALAVAGMMGTYIMKRRFENEK